MTTYTYIKYWKGFSNLKCSVYCVKYLHQKSKMKLQTKYFTQKYV